MRVARVPGRHHAIEHVDAAPHRFEDVLGPAYAHEIARFVSRHLRHQPLEHLVALRRRFSHRQAADAKPRKSDLLECGQGTYAQILMDPALYDAEQRSRWLAGVVFAKDAQR